ncbi:MAG: hypothetical protein ACXVED_18980, partial [Bacteroidia bacterium]
MMLITDISLLLCLGSILFQDLKQREISAILIPLLLTGFLLRGLHSEKIQMLLNGSLINIGFVLIQLFLLTIYFSVRNKKLLNIINTYLGLGDILFFIVSCAAFSPLNFILYHISAMIFSLAGVIIYSRISRKEIREIPLAGTMSCV